MAADIPLSRLVLRAASVTDDVGFVALADLVSIVGNGQAKYRVIGGHMVTALVGRWGLGADMYRETGDTDLGVPPFVVEDLDVVGRLRGLGYEMVSGNRFARSLDDVPAGLAGGRSEPPAATIDVLIPTYTSRARENRRVGKELVTIEVPGLAVALQRQPVELHLEMHRLNGTTLTARVLFPDEVSALVLKANATVVRSKATDVIDVWRCLEIGLAAGLGREDFDFDDGRAAAAVVRQLFADRDGRGMRSLIEAQRLSDLGARQRLTRIHALIGRLLGVS